MRVEFFGVPRQRAGVPELDVEGETLGQLLAALAIRVPALNEFIHTNRLHATLTVNLNGDRFIDDPQTRLVESDHVLILSADAGG